MYCIVLALLALPFSLLLSVLLSRCESVTAKMPCTHRHTKNKTPTHQKFQLAVPDNSYATLQPTKILKNHYFLVSLSLSLSLSLCDTHTTLSLSLSLFDCIWLFYSFIQYSCC